MSPSDAVDERRSELGCRRRLAPRLNLPSRYDSFITISRNHLDSGYRIERLLPARGQAKGLSRTVMPLDFALLLMPFVLLPQGNSATAQDAAEPLSFERHVRPIL